MTPGGALPLKKSAPAARKKRGIGRESLIFSCFWEKWPAPFSIIWPTLAHRRQYIGLKRHLHPLKLGPFCGVFVHFGRILAVEAYFTGLSEAPLHRCHYFSSLENKQKIRPATKMATKKSPDLSGISTRPPVAESSQMPLFLIWAHLAHFGDFGKFRAAAEGSPQTAPLYRAQIRSPINTAFRGGACTPTLGAFSRPLPARVWSFESRNRARGLVIYPERVEKDVQKQKKEDYCLFCALRRHYFLPPAGVEIFGDSFFTFYF
jgi:hypothetical protein